MHAAGTSPFKLGALQSFAWTALQHLPSGQNRILYTVSQLKQRRRVGRTQRWSPGGGALYTELSHTFSHII